MHICTLTLDEAEKFLATHDRHYKSAAEPLCAIGVGEVVADAVQPGDEIKPAVFMLHGAAILGRRDKDTGELAHIYVDGASQGYSLLYGACWRALKALGYTQAVL